MKRLVTYVINVDEDIAEKAFASAVDFLSEHIPNIKVKKSSINVEPHDDYRGIVAAVDFDYVNLDPAQQKHASKALHELAKQMIESQLWMVTNLRVLTETGVSQ